MTSFEVWARAANMSSCCSHLQAASRWSGAEFGWWRVEAPEIKPGSPLLLFA